MLTMANEEQTNRALVSVLSVSSSQTSVSGNQSLVSSLSARNIQPHSAEWVVRTPSGAAAATGATVDPHTQATITSIEKYFPVNKFKLHSILKRWDAPAISDEGSCVVSMLVPNAHI